MDKRCLIISGGDFCPLPEDLQIADLIIACDRGWQYAEKLDLRPDLVLGDFDSAPPPVGDVPIERVPTRKDDTDTMLALRRAWEADCREAVICCAFGGRLDHSYANLQSAGWFVGRGGRARLLGADTDVLVFAGGTALFPRREGWSLSLFALSDRCEGLSVRGTKYTCENVTLTNDFPLGVSNTWASEQAEVSFESGILLAVQSRLKEGEHI